METITLKQAIEMYIALKIISDLQQSLPEPNGNVFYNTFYKFFSLLVFDSKSFMGALVNSKFSAAGLTKARLETDQQADRVKSEKINAINAAQGAKDAG